MIDEEGTVFCSARGELAAMGEVKGEKEELRDIITRMRWR